MIDYQLAKELKDAGFPQKLAGKISIENQEEFSTEIKQHGMAVFNYLYYPTLSELIEACEPDKADDFNLYTNLDQWTAHIQYHGFFEGWKGIPRDGAGSVSINMGCSAPTPEEAVARLWLALNEKKS